MSRPNIRFKEFDDDWVQRQFEECYKMSSGYAFKFQDYQEDGIGLVNGESIQHGYIDDSNMNYLPSSFQDEYPDFTLKVGDIVVGLNRPITNGHLKIARISRKYDGTLLYQRAGKVEYKKEIDKNFSYVILSKEILAYTIKEAVGSDQPFISTSKLNKWSMMMPYDFEEQKRIGSFFTRLDKLIALHQRKCDNLKEVKKYMLQKMFPKNGEKVPEIRFAGFTGDWEQRKVIDIAPLQRGFDLPTTEMKPGEYPVVMSNGIGGWHSEYKAKGPGVITGRSGTIGKLHYVESDYWPHNTTLWVTDFKGNNPKFVYHLYDRLDLSRFGTGSGVPTLNRNDVHDTKVDIPAYEEQKKIADYLDGLDNLITLYQRKCDTLKEVKKYMLQNMFPQGKVGPAVGDDR